MRRVLVVDDDPHIREVVCFALEKSGFETCEASDGRAALERFETLQPELIVLDVLMPELDGVEVCREIRKRAATPILFLSSQDDEVDRILGLEIGGDDYVTKPFSPRELVARVKALLRRAQGPDDTSRSQLTAGPLRLDLDGFEASWEGKRLVLTATEFGILSTLAAHPGRVFSRDALMENAYATHRVVSDRTIDSHVRRLRAKLAQLGANPVQTVHGIGYRLNPR